MSSSDWPPWTSVLAGLAIVGFALYLAVAPAGEAWTYVQHDDATETTTGRLESLSVEETNRGIFSVDVRYRYVVRGTTYTGTMLYQHGDDRLFSYESTRDLRANYSVGDTVTVHYDPDDPARSYLRPVDGSEFLWETLVGPAVVLLAILLLGLVVTWAGLSERRQRRQSW